MSGGMKNKDWVALAGWLIACFAAAAVGGAFTATSVTSWYPTIAKPTWTPPAGLFGPVWTTLYAMMGIAAFLIWKKVGWRDGRTALGLFVIQLVLNCLWSVLFFGLQSPIAGLIDIIVLWVAIALTVVSFFRARVLAGWLLVPYLLWVSFAAALNFAIWRLNLPA